MATHAIQNPTRPEPRRFLIRLPWPLWLGLTAAVVLLLAIGLRVGFSIYRRQMAIREIERVGGKVTTEPAGPAWLRNFAGDERMKLFGTTLQAFLPARRKTNYRLLGLENLTDLQDLVLDETEVTDADMWHLAGLTHLHFITIKGPISDTGLRQLRRLTSLRHIEIRDAQVTGTGLIHLADLSELRELNLIRTRVTDAELVHLSRLTKLNALGLMGSQVTASGMVHLSGLPQLQALSLRDTQVADDNLSFLAGLKQVQWLDVAGTRITDNGLMEIHGMSGLKMLIVRRTQVTEAGIAELQRIRPGLTISR